MRFFQIFLLSLLMGYYSNANEVIKTQTPQWVQTISFSDEKISDQNGGFQYLLIDKQGNLIEQSLYLHVAIKALNSDGIQSISDISISFDPAFQELQFHLVQIIRDGKILDKLTTCEIGVFQRETNLERFIYDGSLTAVINISDVRENDIIEYAYSIKGANPIYDGNVSTSFYHQFTTPVNRVFNKLTTNQKTEIYFKFHNGASKPEILWTDDKIEYTWDINALDYLLYDNNTPPWLNVQKHVSLTSFTSWEDVVNLAIPLYKYSKKDINEIRNSLDLNQPIEARILKLIRLVQDDIRYLGFGSGIGAYKPNSPLKVFKQRYGDCKDKSLLLVALLQSEGVSAFPLLVNSQYGHETYQPLPGITAFDHCVVRFIFDGKEYFIDPTLSNQGGDLQHFYFPNYKKGLLIKAGQTKLIDIPESKPPSISIKEIIIVDSIGGRATMKVKTTFNGSEADYTRYYFNTTSLELIQKGYLTFYSNLYPKITIRDNIKFFDDSRNSSNDFITEEHYNIDEYCLQQEDESLIYCEIYPIVLESRIDYPQSSGRKMPYYLGEPYSFSQTTLVYLPEVWPVNDLNLTIDGDGFLYKNTISENAGIISVTHDYVLTKESIPGALVDTFLKKHEDIQNTLSYILYYDQSIAGFKLSWISIILTLLAITVGTIFAFKIYRNFNPPAHEYAEDKAIGGWLILPAIGITISPIVLSIQIFTNGFFNHNTWLYYYNSEIDQLTNVLLLFGTEIVYNFLLLIFALLILILFYQRRTSIPTLITIFYIANVLGPLIDLILVETIIPGQFMKPDTYGTFRDIASSFLRAAIWIPYFNISERVKDTFCKRYNNINQSREITNRKSY